MGTGDFRAQYSTAPSGRTYSVQAALLRHARRSRSKFVAVPRDRATARPVGSLDEAMRWDGMVGAAGFEPTTCSTQNCRATRLRYTPISWKDHVTTRSRAPQQDRGGPAPGWRSRDGWSRHASARRRLRTHQPREEVSPGLPNSAVAAFRPLAQCDDSAGEPVSGWISAAIMPLEPGP